MVDKQKLDEIEKITERIWKLADNLIPSTRAMKIKVESETIRELVRSIKEPD